MDEYLYRQLAPNPYSPRAEEIISQHFSNELPSDVIKAVILAEPEGLYDQHFRQLSKTLQEKELSKQKKLAKKIHTRLIQYCHKHSKELSLRHNRFVYNSLCTLVFETADGREVEQRYPQQQRQNFKLSIVHFIEDPQSFTKPSSQRPLLTVMIAALSVVATGVPAMAMYEKQVEQRQLLSIAQAAPVQPQILGIETSKEFTGSPVRLKIPRLDVDAAIEHVGVASNGEMEPPKNIDDVGWFDLGPVPGERGSAVIAGHFNGEHGEEAIFAQLNKLEEGDKLYVEDANGTAIAFVVQKSRTYDPGYADEVFSRNDGVYLNLITCEGVWDATKKSYSKRLVVFAGIAD